MCFFDSVIKDSILRYLKVFLKECISIQLQIYEQTNFYNVYKYRKHFQNVFPMLIGVVKDILYWEGGVGGMT